MTTADELADMLAAQHVETFRANPSGSILQSCLIVPEDREQADMIVACPWGDASERAMVLALLRGLMAQVGAIRYAMWAEVWFVREPFKGDDPEAAMAAHRPGDLALRPDKVEAVFTIVVDASGKRVSRLQQITRGRNGGVRRLEPADESMTELGGAFADLLPPRSIN